MAKNVTIALKTDALENLAPIFNEQYMESLRRDARYSSTTFAVDLDALTDEELDKFVEWLQAKKARQAVLKVKSYIEVKNDSASAKIKSLQNFCKALKTEMSKLKNKWMFVNADKTDEYLPYLILGVTYSEAEGRGEYFKPAKVIIKGVYNGVSGYNTKNWVFYEGDIPGTTTVKDILSSKNMIMENDTMMDDYVALENRYLIEKKNFNKEYKGNGLFISTNYRHEQASTMINMNLVNDEEMNNNTVHRRVSTKFWTDGVDDETYIAPCHPYLYVYSLSTYENGFVHISSVKDYV